MKKILIPTLLMLLSIALLVRASETKPLSTNEGPTGADSIGSAVSPLPEGKLIAYYFHGNRRCATCQKLEAYSFEALHDNFKPALEDSSIVWRVVNFEAEGNEHYVDDYKLFTQSLILSRVVDGKEVEWRNLDKIWKLVSDKEQYLSYVADEIRAFIDPDSE